MKRLFCLAETWSGEKFGGAGGSGVPVDALMKDPPEGKAQEGDAPAEDRHRGMVVIVGSVVGGVCAILLIGIITLAIVGGVATFKQNRVTLKGNYACHCELRGGSVVYFGCYTFLCTSLLTTVVINNTGCPIPLPRK